MHNNNTREQSRYLEAPLVRQADGELKNNFFQNHNWGGTVEELFAYIFGIYKKFGGNNPSILTPCYSVAVAT